MEYYKVSSAAKTSKVWRRRVATVWVVCRYNELRKFHQVIQVNIFRYELLVRIKTLRFTPPEK